MFLLRSLSANYYYYLNLFSKRRCRMQLENLKILKMRSNKSEKLQSLLWRCCFWWELNPGHTRSMYIMNLLAMLAVYSFNNSTTRSNNVIKETGVFQTYSIAFSRFSNFHREFSNFPIAFCNVFSKINLNNKIYIIFKWC